MLGVRDAQQYLEVVSTYLDAILAGHREVAAGDRRKLDPLLDEAKRMPTCRGFGAALAKTDGLGVIAEIKRRSPSRGALLPDLLPDRLAKQYEAGGATCLSVLTDVDHFGGSAEDLADARNAVSLPVIRKDFTVSALDVVDARLMGADAVLLICAALDDRELADFLSLSREVGLDALVETHDEAEVARALECGADIIGVNQRDLVTFEVDTNRAVRVAGSIPPSVLRVAESGVRGPEDACELAAAGYHAVLVGETLVTSADPEAMVGLLRAAKPTE